MGRYSKVVRKKKTARRGVVPQAAKVFIARRVIDSAALCALAGGLFVLGAIISYSHADPSFNTAAATDVSRIHNWLALPGAYVADLLLQTLGLGGLAFGVIFLAWGVRIFRRESLNPAWIRIVTLVLGALAASMAFAAIPSGEWMTHAWLGGSGGTMMLEKFGNLLHPVAHGFARPLAAILSGLAAIALLCKAAAVNRYEIEAFFGFAGDTALTASSHLAGKSAALYGWVRHYDATADANAGRAPKPAVEKTPKPAKSSASPVVAFDDDDDAEMMEEPSHPKAPGIIKVVSPKKAAKPQPANGDARQTSFALPGASEDWEFPPLDLLQEVPEETTEMKPDEAALQKNAVMLQQVLGDFNISGDVVSIHPGPVVTLYELEPAPGTKTSRVISLSDDIARSMSAISVRSAVVPGRNVIGIELPNKRRQTVYMRELLESHEIQTSRAKLPLVLGKDIGGGPIIADLAKMPHLLVAGTTGSGKSVAVNTMILSLLYRLPPEKCRFIMIDPKMLELSVYQDIPHLLSPVVTEPGKAVVSLKWAVAEMENRYRSMSRLGVRNIDGYNARLEEARNKGEILMRKVQTGFEIDTGKPIYEEQPMDMSELPYIVIVVDEFADLMLVAGKDVEGAIQRLAQMARAAGIHLIMATQRPSVDVITGVIKANFPTRISFQVTSKIDSRTILGEGGAEQLLGMGDMLYMAAGGQIKRVHGPFVSDEDVEQVVTFLKAQAEPAYLEEVTENRDFGDSETLGALFGEGGGAGGSGDELYDKAVAIVARERKASTSFIQRHLQIGYNRAATLIEKMEKEGVVGPANHVGKREVLVGDYSDA